MKWPRGKYNGRFIVGFSVTFRARFHRWFWKPRFYTDDGLLINWGWFQVAFSAEYGLWPK